MVLLGVYFALSQILTGRHKHLKNRGTFEEFYHILETIAENSDSQVRVFKVMRLSDKAIFCAKMFYKSARIKRGDANEKNEIHYLKLLQPHRNIVKLEEYFDQSDKIVLILEYLELTLYDILKTYKRLAEENVRSIARTLFTLLSHLETHNVVHGDLVLQNFMLQRDSDDVESLRMVDFNTCDTQDNRAGKNRLTSREQFLSSQPSSIAPETIQTYELTCKSDVWSAGVIIYTLIFGTVPFNGRNANEIYLNVLMKPVSFEVLDSDTDSLLSVSVECQDFLTSILDKDPKQRISAQTALHHPWLKRIIKCNKTDE